MTATVVTQLPEGAQWLYEVKLDGYRALILRDRDRVGVISRNEKDLASAYPAVAHAGRRLEATTAVIDLDGRDLTGMCLEERRALPQVLGESGVLLSPELPGTATQVSAAVARLGLEGVIAKRRDSRDDAAQRSGLGQAQTRQAAGVRRGRLPAGAAQEMQWLKPVRAAPIRFVEWTADGHLRHASFLGLRSDKAARQVDAGDVSDGRERNAIAIPVIAIAFPWFGSEGNSGPADYFDMPVVTVDQRDAETRRLAAESEELLEQSFMSATPQSQAFRDYLDRLSLHTRKLTAFMAETRAPE